jgi:hypothetical protein
MPREFDNELTYRRGIDSELEEIKNPMNVTLTPRSVNQEPTLVATSGSIGEVVYFGNGLYRKHTSNGRDKNWTKIT